MAPSIRLFPGLQRARRFFDERVTLHDEPVAVRDEQASAPPPLHLRAHLFDDGESVDNPF